MEITTATIAYFSPNGSTREIGMEFKGKLEEGGIKTRVLDLTCHSIASIKEITANDVSHPGLLVIGSPVYAHHPPEAVMAFLENLPASRNTIGVVFVTYGAVSAGSTIREIAKVLEEKKVHVYHGLKFIAKHSLIFDAGNDMFSERPGEKEFMLVEEFTTGMLEDIRQVPTTEGLDRLEIDDLPPRTLKGKVVAKAMRPGFIQAPAYHKDRCTLCGKCVEACSTNALSIIEGERVTRNKDCSKCFNCARVCPNNAWTSGFPGLLIKLHGRKTRNIDESKVNKVY